MSIPGLSIVGSTAADRPLGLVEGHSTLLAESYWL